MKRQPPPRNPRDDCQFTPFSKNIRKHSYQGGPNPLSVIYQTAEDGLADTVKPRLEEAGADCCRILVIDDSEKSLTMDDDRLEKAILQTGARLLILDPIQAYLWNGVDMNRANEARDMTKKLGQLAERTGCAIVLNGHMNKAGGFVHIYFGLLFNEHVYKPIELIESYTNDMPLLQNMYFSMLQYDRHEDHSGIFIANFVKIDFSWVELYADYLYSNLDNYHDDAHERFNTCWQCTNYLEIFDYIFDYIVEKDNLYRWRSKFVFSHMLIHEEKEIETAKRQREWIFHIIEKNCNNDKIYIIFEILSELGEDIRREALTFFISSNQDYSVFEKLILEANHWSWSGSLVPIIQRRKQYFESLLPYLTGINLLEHKKLIREKMKMCDKEIEREQVDEIFRELYD